MLTPEELQIYKRIFNQNRGYVHQVTQSTIYCKRRVRLARILARKLFDTNPNSWPY